MQLVHGRRIGRLPGEHLGMLRRQIALPQIAGRAGGDDVFPGGLATFAPGDDVVEGEVVGRGAVPYCPSSASSSSMRDFREARSRCSSATFRIFIRRGIGISINEILLSLSKLYAVAANSEVLQRLALTPSEMELVLFGEERHAKNPFSKIFPWL
jgi:hypothetical protein